MNELDKLPTVRCPVCKKRIPDLDEAAARMNHALLRTSKGTFVLCPKMRIKQE